MANPFKTTPTRTTHSRDVKTSPRPAQKPMPAPKPASKSRCATCGKTHQF